MFIYLYFVLKNIFTFTPVDKYSKIETTQWMPSEDYPGLLKDEVVSCGDYLLMEENEHTRHNDNCRGNFSV